MVPFDFHPRTRIVFGPNKVDTLGDLVVFAPVLQLKQKLPPIKALA